jgi:hypothetical protein
MNLVAKEFVACQNDDSPGVLILSPFAGAGGLMHEALMVSYIVNVDVDVIKVVAVVIVVIVVAKTMTAREFLFYHPSQEPVDLCMKL